MRILFVAATFSPIAARWISQLADTRWDIHVYSTSSDIHPMIMRNNVTVYSQIPIHSMITRLINSSWPFSRGSYRLSTLFVRLARVLVPEPGQYIASLVNKLEPDCIHSLKTWNEGRYVLAAKKLLGNSLTCPWMHSVWGVDIHPQRDSPKQIQLIREVLSNCNYLLAGSSLDKDLAYKYGFSGHDFGVIPSGGGYDINQMQALIETASPSQRKVIAVKGYQTNGPGGKVLTALEALKLCGDILAGYTVVIHSAIGTHASKYLDDVRAAANEVSDHCKVAVEFMPLSPLEIVWQLFGKSRIALAISSADGIPNAMLEAMIMGAYPIQSDTGGLDTWIEHGVNGSLAPYDDPQAIADAIRIAISDDQLVEKAAEMNRAATNSRIDTGVIRPRVIQTYQAILESSRKAL